MSHEHDVTVVRLGEIRKHPNADTLSITEVLGCPVILRTGDYAEGELAAYVPVDSVVPGDAERWAFLRHTPDDVRPIRIRAKRLRGIFSMGLLAKPEPDMAEGDEIRERWGIVAYEAPMALTIGGDNEPDPGLMPCYTDIDGWRRYRRLLVDGEQIVATEKIHGANGRYLWRDGRLWVGSRTGIKREDPRSIWWQAAYAADLAAKLATVPGIAVYGEVYGQVQDLKYGVTSGARFVAFDAMDTTTRRYLDYHDFDVLMDRLKLDVVPVLYHGPYDPEAIAALAEGKTVFADGVHVREGFVVRPVAERFDERLGRVILKLAGEGYHLRKGAA